MDKLYFNLSEEEFSKERKILLWIFVTLFFLAGIYVAMASPVFGQKSIPPVLCIAPFGISLIVSVFATFATIKRKDLFFLIDNEKIEFRYGLFKPKKHLFLWADVKELIMPHKQKKAKLCLKDGTCYIIDLTYLQRRKAAIIRKHIFHAAREKDLEVKKVSTIS